MKSHTETLPSLLTAIALGACSLHDWAAKPPKPEDTYYNSGEKIYELRPKSDSRKEMDHIGPNGILSVVDIGVVVKIEGARPGSPAEPRFSPS